MLKVQAAKQRRSRRFRFVAATVAIVASMSVAASNAYAAPPKSDIAVIAGVCAVVGTVTEQFSPAVGALPSTVKATLLGTGVCEGSGLGDQISVSLTTNALLSCAGGEGTLGGSISFISGFPPPTAVTGLYFGTAGSAAFEVTGPGLTVVAALAWSPTATATCALSGTASTPLYGSLVYVYE